MQGPSLIKNYAKRYTFALTHSCVEFKNRVRERNVLLLQMKDVQRERENIKIVGHAMIVCAVWNHLDIN